MNIKSAIYIFIILAFFGISVILAVNHSNNVISEKFTIDGKSAFTKWLHVDDIAAVKEIKTVDDPKSSDYIPVETMEDYLFNGGPVLWGAVDLSEVFVDSDLFSDLKVVDMTNLNEEISVGFAKDVLRKNWGVSKVIMFLIDVEILRTYVHLEAELSIESAENTEEYYQENYSAVHSYCTNECVDVPYQFSVRIDKNSGEVKVIPVS